MKIDWLIVDVDGVLTDGSIIYTSSGEEIKTFNAQDGLGLALARMAGIKLAVITGRTSPMVERRAQELKFTHICMGSLNKSDALAQLVQSENIDYQSIAYIGDDLNDLGVMLQVGLPMTPANGVAEVQAVAKYVATRNGGQGAVRECIEYILKQAGTWDALVDAYRRESYGKGQ